MLMISAQEYRKEYLDGKSLKKVKEEIERLKYSIEFLQGNAESGIFSDFEILNADTRIGMYLEYLEEAKVVLEGLGGQYRLSKWERKSEKLAERFDKVVSATYTFAYAKGDETRNITFDGEKVHLEIVRRFGEDTPPVYRLMKQTRTQFLNSLRSLRLGLWLDYYKNGEYRSGMPEWYFILNFNRGKRAIWGGYDAQPWNFDEMIKLFC